MPYQRCCIITIEVIYENGVFKPLKKVDLPERTRGEVIIRDEDDIDELSKKINDILKETKIEEDPLEVLLEMRRRPINNRYIYLDRSLYKIEADLRSQEIC